MANVNEEKCKRPDRVFIKRRPGFLFLGPKILSLFFSSRRKVLFFPGSWGEKFFFYRPKRKALFFLIRNYLRTLFFAKLLFLFYQAAAFFFFRPEAFFFDQATSVSFFSKVRVLFFFTKAALLFLTRERFFFRYPKIRSVFF